MEAFRSEFSREEASSAACISVLGRLVLVNNNLKIGGGVDFLEPIDEHILRDKFHQQRRGEASGGRSTGSSKDEG